MVSGGAGDFGGDVLLVDMVVATLMPTFDINDIARLGSVRDVKSYMLPMEAWTVALNMRYEDESLKTLEGWKQVFGTPPASPHFGMFVAVPVALLETGSAPTVLAWASLTDLYWYNGTSHTVATRASGSYTSTHTRQWNGTIAGGGIPIFNSGMDVPQYSGTPGTGVFADLPNWPATWRAKVIRAFGPHLVAINMVEGDVQLPHRIRWSHPATPGTLPSSWDESDPTKDAGFYSPPDEASGVLLDALPLGSIMYLYEETSISRMRYVGGQSKFDFGQSAWVQNDGILGTGSVCITGDGTKHVFASSNGDIMWHDGNRIDSVLNLRQRRRLQADIDPDHMRNSFIFSNPFTHSVWFCYPGVGQQYPDRALHMSYKRVGGTEWVVTEVNGVTFRNAIVGTIPAEGMSFGLWDEVDGVLWDDDVVIWNTGATAGSGTTVRHLIFIDPERSKFYASGMSATRDGAVFVSALQRIGLGLMGKRKNGEPIEDFQRKKMITRVFPKIVGEYIEVRFNSQQVVDGPVSNGASVVYVPADTVFADPQTMEGRTVGLEMFSDLPWQIDGYKINIEPLGEF